MEIQVKKIIASVLKVSFEKVTNDLAIGDINEWDSLGHMMIISNLQKEFNVKFEPSELADIETVADIIALVHEYHKKQ